MTAYRSILEKRTRDVRREDFEGLPHFYFNTHFMPALNDRDIAYWNQVFPYFPRQIYRLFADSFEKDICLKFIRQEDESIKIEIASIGEKEFDVVSNFYPDNVDLESDGTMQVVPEFQGRGYGKKYFRAQTEFKLAMGAVEHSFDAGLGNGGYTWAKTGAHINLAEWRMSSPEEIPSLSKMLIGRLECVKDQIDFYVYNYARALCRVVAKDDLARLAQIKEGVIQIPERRDVGALVKGKIGESLRAFYAGCFDSNPRHKAIEECKRLSSTFESAVQRNVTLNLPAYLLSGAAWPARINYADEAQMKQVARYVGGFKSAVPVLNLAGSY